MLDLMILGRAEFIAPDSRRRYRGVGRNTFERAIARAIVARVRRMFAKSGA